MCVNWAYRRAPRWQRDGTQLSLMGLMTRFRGTAPAKPVGTLLHVTSAAAPTDRQLTAGRVAAALVALEAVALAGFALYYLVSLLRGEGSDTTIVIMSVVTMVVFIVGLAYVAAGLRRRHPRAQAPAIAFNFLLVPLGIAMFQFAPAWLAAVVLGAALAVIYCTLQMGRLD